MKFRLSSRDRIRKDRFLRRTAAGTMGMMRAADRSSQTPRTDTQGRRQAPAPSGADESRSADGGPSSIFLIGMMACGKSTVGRHLAQRLGWDFVDVDRAIEQRTGVSISCIFAVEGEAGFRAREAQMLAELTHRSGIVVATGGGAPMFEISRRLLAQGLVIELATTVSDIIERTQHDTTRPLLQAPDRIARIRALMLERGPVYDSCCAHKVMTTRKSPEVVVNKILALRGVAEVVERGNRLRRAGDAPQGCGTERSNRSEADHD